MTPEIIIVVERFAVLCRIENRQSMHRFLLSVRITGLSRDRSSPASPSPNPKRAPRYERQLLSCADDHRLRSAIAACARRPIDAHGSAARAISAGHDLARPARRLTGIADHPETGAGSRRALRSGRSCRALRTRRPHLPLRSSQSGGARMGQAARTDQCARSALEGRSRRRRRFRPWAQRGPTAPASPLAPAAPASPFGPVSPASPFGPAGPTGPLASSLAFRPCIPGVALRPRWAGCSRWSDDADFALGSCCANIAFRPSGPRGADRANFALWSNRADITLWPRRSGRPPCADRASASGFAFWPNRSCQSRRPNLPGIALRALRSGRPLGSGLAPRSLQPGRSGGADDLLSALAARQDLAAPAVPADRLGRFRLSVPAARRRPYRLSALAVRWRRLRPARPSARPGRRDPAVPVARVGLVRPCRPSSIPKRRAARQWRRRRQSSALVSPPTRRVPTPHADVAPDYDRHV